jgi:creatinine amidohydrolase
MTGGKPILLGELTWPAIARLIQDGETMCLLPTGATEQHGRHLPASTDTEIALAVCHGASGRTGVPVLPPLAVTSSQAHTTAWPGTFSLAPRTLVQVVVEIARWITASGFAKLLIVNAHVGNVAPLKVAVDEIRHEGALRAGVVNWWQLTSEIEAALCADADDWHANAAETAMMLHLRPELVRPDEIADDPDRTGGRAFSYTVAETSRDGLTGTPSAGTAEEGSRLLGAAISALADLVEWARVEEPPSLDRGNERED